MCVEAQVNYAHSCPNCYLEFPKNLTHYVVHFFVIIFMFNMYNITMNTLLHECSIGAFPIHAKVLSINHLYPS